MAPNDEVLVDELRFGRMFQRLQRAGMFRRCGCAGCAPCAESAQRLLSGVAQGGRFSGYYRPERWGDRYRVYERPTHSGTVSVLTDMAQQPTVVDVNVQAASSEDGDGEEFELLSDLLLRRLPKQVLPSWRQQLASRLNKYPLVFTEVKQPSLAPATAGLYVIQWRGGQYLGETNNLQKRLQVHQTDWNRHSLSPLPRRMYYVALSNPKTKEHQILKDVAELAGQMLSLPVQRDHFKTLFRAWGLSNQSTELEFV